jgi:hypothetical protein
MGEKIMITHGIALEAKKALITGVHQPGDEYRIALYSASAKIGPTTKAYTTEGEIKGMGYTAGGVALKGHRTGIIGKNAFITFDDVVLKSATFATAGAMIYNASKGNAALCILNLGAERHVYDGAFELKFPKPTETSALILLA